MTTATGRFYIIYWHQPRDIGHLDGWDLVFATSQREAVKAYRVSHFSLIDYIIAEGDGHEWVFNDLTNLEREKARGGEVVNIETGS